MPTPLTLDQLRTDCLNIVAQAEIYAPLAGACLGVMLTTGCREGETLDRSRWTPIDLTNWELQPQKGNPVRTVPAILLPEQFKSWLTSSVWPYQLSSLMNIRRLVDRFSHYPHATCGTKQISSHRFRHLVIKTMDNDGASLSEIKTFIGLASDSVVNNYINAPIYP